MFMNVDRVEPGLRPGVGEAARTRHRRCRVPAATLEDRWILSRFNRRGEGVNESLASYRFDEAANSNLRFLLGRVLRLVSRADQAAAELREGADTTAARVACANLVALFEASLRLLHPVMPFITEEIWHAMYDGKPPQKSIALAAYPRADEKQIDLAAETEMAILQDLIVSVRNLRAELKVEPKVKVPIEVFAQSRRFARWSSRIWARWSGLANVEKVTFVESSLANLPGARNTARFDVHVIYEKKIDVAAECERLKKELGEDRERNWQTCRGSWANEQFLAKAPAQVVEGLRTRVEELTVLREKTLGQLKELGCSSQSASVEQSQLARADRSDWPPDHWRLTLWTGIDDALPRLSRTRCNEDRATRDATSYACIDPNQRASATILAKQDCILAGLGCVPRILDVYAALDGAVTSHYEVTSHPSIFDGIRAA